MLVPLSWLRDFAPFELTVEDLGLVFDDLGMVVEGVERTGEGLDGVVLGRVLEVAPIEGARVRRTRVDVGAEHGHDVQIVCGAANVEAGQLVPVAVVGAVLPGDFAIGRRKVMGIESNGMICSGRELALSEEAAGIMVLPDDLGAPGDPFAAAMGITRDAVYDLAIETNRPDANCVGGVARDAAARLGLPFSMPAVDTAALVALPAPDVLPVVDAAAGALAPRVAVAVLEGVTVGPSPAWLAARLTAAGMRPINNLVDLSNYVMLELGQPTHPYDLDRLPGAGISVRLATAGETVVTLDDAERRLGEGKSPDVLICDAVGTPVGIAGIMGGASSEIHDGTTRVLLEAAHFDKRTIAKTSKRLGLRSEASKRFERGVDPLGIEAAVARFAQLAAEVCGARLTAWAVAESPADVPLRTPIPVRTARVNALLGSDLSTERVVELLTPIGFTAEATDAPDVLLVTAPSFRLDVEQEADVIEEVARHHGYSNLPRTLPRSPLAGGLTPYQAERRRVRDVLAGAGFTEAIGGLLVGPGDHARAGLDESAGAVITASDPLAKEESVLRRSLRPGLLRAIAFNLDRRVATVPLFEVGHVFAPGDGAKPTPYDPAEAHLPDEDEHLLVLLGGEGADAPAAVRAWLLLADALRLDGASMVAADDEPGTHPSRTARVVGADGGRLGVVGEVDPDVLTGLGIAGRVGVLEVDLPALLAEPRRPGEAQSVSRFPSSEVDLAFAVDEATPAAAVLAALRASGGDLLDHVELFDVYRGAGVPHGQRSLAFRLRFTSHERTLTDADVGAARQGCIDAVTASLPATLR